MPGAGSEFSAPGVPPGETLVCHPMPSKFLSSVCFVELFPAGQPRDASSTSTALHDGSKSTSTSPVFESPPEYFSPRERTRYPCGGIESLAANNIFIVPPRFKSCQPASGTVPEELFLSSSHSREVAADE